ncbi:GntR family transcriptional regulator [Dermatophilaceae bacterium Sec6.4]|nr:GntR family transcriptional regulator [Actinomycetota bacterium]
MIAGLRIDPGDTASPYEQICRQIVAGTTAGELPPGTRLPTVRALATGLGVAPGTVAKAYTRLEQAGVVQGRGRAGTFISAGSQESGALAVQAARTFAEQTRDLGLGADELLAIARAALENV